MSRYVISFSHLGRVGKDTACDFLVDNYGFTKMAFADSLKEECAQLYDYLCISGTGNLVVKNYLSDGKLHKYAVDRPEFLTDELIQHGMREKHPALLQWWGTDIRRATHPNYWVERLADKIENFKGSVCISDCRFPNEIEFIRGQGGLTVKINRPHRPIDRDVNHPSETALSGYDGWDYVLDNDGTLEQYHEILKTWAAQVFGD